MRWQPSPAGRKKRLRLANPLRPACLIPPKAAHARDSRLRWFFLSRSHLLISSRPGNEGPPEARKHCLRRHTQALLFTGLVGRRTLLSGRVEAKPVTTAGTKWSGWRGLCRGWGFFAAIWLSCEVPLAGRSISLTAAIQSDPLDVSPDLPGRNMERHMLGGRRTVADRVGGSLRPEREPPRCKDGVVRGASLSPMMLNCQKANPLHAPWSEARMGHLHSRRSRTHGAAAPPQPRALARPGA